MIYYSSKEPFAFRIFKTRSFSDDIYSGKISINEESQEQADLVEYILNFNKARPKSKDDKKNKENVFNTAKNLYEWRELVTNDFTSRLFPLKSTTGTGLKITPKQLIQRLSIALAQVKTGAVIQKVS